MKIAFFAFSFGSFAFSSLGALSAGQIDEIIKLMPSLFQLIGVFLTGLTTLIGGLLLFFQQRNKRDLTAEVVKSTAKTEAYRADAKVALDTANNTNQKIADFHDTVAAAVKEIRDATPAISKLEEIPRVQLVPDLDHPLPVVLASTQNPTT